MLLNCCTPGVIIRINMEVVLQKYKPFYRALTVNLFIVMCHLFFAVFARKNFLQKINMLQKFSTPMYVISIHVHV